MTPALECRDVRVAIDGTDIVRGVDVSVEPGGWLTVIGPNGAGKTTFLRALVGQVASSGRIDIKGRSAAGMSRRDRARLMALVAQDPIVPLGMTVADYALLGRTPHLGFLAFDGPSDREHVAKVLARLDLSGLAERELASLSGGERQRTYIARALVQASPIVLLDEPTTALDIGHQQDVLSLIDELRVTESLTVVSTMHDLTVAGSYADELIMMAGGVVAATGAPRDVLTETLIEQHYGARVTVIDQPGGPIVVPKR